MQGDQTFFRDVEVMLPIHYLLHTQIVELHSIAAVPTVLSFDRELRLRLDLLHQFTTLVGLLSVVVPSQ